MTRLVATTAFDSVIPAAVEFRLTVFAVIVPIGFVKAPEETRVTVPIVPALAARLPCSLSVPLGTFSTNEKPFPAEEAFSFTALAVSFATLTLAVELTVKVVAALELILIPPEPARTVKVGLESAELAKTAPAADGALSVSEDEAGRSELSVMLPRVELNTMLLAVM